MIASSSLLRSRCEWYSVMKSGGTKPTKAIFLSSKSPYFQWKGNIEDEVWQQLKRISIRSQPHWPRNECVFSPSTCAKRTHTDIQHFCYLLCHVGVFNPKIHTGVLCLNSSTNLQQKAAAPSAPLIHTPPWITGFSSIRAVLSWLKLYYQEIRESLGDGAMNSLAGQATELGSFWSAFSKTTEVAVCGYLSQRGMVGVVPTKKTREKKSNCKSIPL